MYLIQIACKSIIYKKIIIKKSKSKYNFFVYKNILNNLLILEQLKILSKNTKLNNNNFFDQKILKIALNNNNI